jgi:hypothetical protein
VRARAFLSAIAIGLISGIAIWASVNLAVGRSWNANPQMALVILVVIIGASVYEMWRRLKVLNG